MKSLISMLDMSSTPIFCSKIAQTGKKLLEVARTIKSCSKRQKLLKSCRVQSGQANHIIGRPHFLFVVIVDTIRTKSMRVVNKALKIAYLNYLLV